MKIIFKLKGGGVEKLKLIRSRVNSGGAAFPRNIGLNISIGDYVLFMDSDDAFTRNAIEVMYTLAKNSDVDVVYCEKFFSVDNTVKNIHLQKNLNLTYGAQHGGFVREITQEDINLPLLVRKFCSEHYEMPPWSKLVKRGILVNNGITFPNLRTYDDLIWTFKVLCHSKKLLRVPIATYIHRENPTSITSRKETAEKNITFWSEPVIDGLKILDDFMLEFEFFQENLLYRYAVLDFFSQLLLKHFVKHTEQVPSAYMYAVLNQFNSEKFGEHNALISYLWSLVNSQQKTLMNAQYQILEMQRQINRFIING